MEPPTGDPLTVVRTVYRAVEEGDHDTLRTCLADDLRWHQAGHAVPAAGGPRVGAVAFLDDVIRPFEETWDGFTETLAELIDAGSKVVATGRYGGTYVPTGRTVDAEFCHIWTVVDGAIREFRQFTDTAAFGRTMAEDASDGDGGRPT